MANNIAKFAPIGLVAGAMGYFCWSHLDEMAPAGAAGAAAKSAELTASLLQPAAAPELSRDPFVVRGAAPPEPQAQAKKDSRAATTMSAHFEQAAQGTRPPPMPATTNPANATARVDSAKKSRIAGDYALNGTYLSAGGQRMAIINGSIYAQGQRLAIDKSAKDVVTVDRVDVDRVTLKSLDGTAELVYSESARRHELAQRTTSRPRDIQMANEHAADSSDREPQNPFATSDAPPTEAGLQTAPAGTPPAKHTGTPSASQ